MHVILGAGGPVSNALASELTTKKIPTRLVSRKPVTRFPETEWVKADLTRREEVMQAVKGAEVIYMCAGLKYDKKVWAVEWPMITANLVDAAAATGARLIFFDNVYMYGYVKGPMTEDTPYNPSSVKGEIRAKTARRLMEESAAGNISATIARAADFYGAESHNSFLDSMVLAKYAKGEKALWLGNASSKHAFTYVPDAGHAMFLLGQEPSSANQVWHVPTAPAMSGHDFLRLAATVFHTDPRFFEVRKLLLQAIGLFNPLIRESVELYYQYQYDYIFDSSKFEKAFNVQPHSYEAGIRALPASFWVKDQ